MYERILIVVDKRPSARAAVLHGTAVAATSGAEVVFFSVLPRNFVPSVERPLLPGATQARLEREAAVEADRRLASALVSAHRAGVRARVASGIGDDAARVIAAAARRRRCDLIVVAAAEPAAGLIDEATVPVLVCRGPVRPPARAARRAKTKSPALPIARRRI